MIPGTILAGAARLLGRAWPYLLGVAAIIGAGLYLDHRGYQRGADDVRAEWGRAQVKAAEAALAAEQAARAEEQRRIAAQLEIVDGTIHDLAAARRDADGARAAGDQLRAQINRATAACLAAGNPALGGGSAAAGATADLLADVQRRLDEAANGIARHADEARAAGRACERSYDALTAGP